MQTDPHAHTRMTPSNTHAHACMHLCMPPHAHNFKGCTHMQARTCDCRGHADTYTCVHTPNSKGRAAAHVPFSSHKRHPNMPAPLRAPPPPWGAVIHLRWGSMSWGGRVSGHPGPSWQLAPSASPSQLAQWAQCHLPPSPWGARGALGTHGPAFPPQESTWRG